MGRHSKSPTPGSWRGDTEPLTVVPDLVDLEVKEAAGVALFNELLEQGHTHDVVLLDADTVGLMVDGQLRATYRQEATYQPGSVVANARLQRAAREAAAAENLARGFARGAGAVPGGVAAQSTEGEAPPLNDEGELSGIEKFIGQVSDATSAERATMRDRRPEGRELIRLGDDAQPARVVVEGVE